MIEVLMHERNEFTKECSEKSDMCKYIMQGREVINLTELLISADRDGNWGLRVVNAEKLLRVFLEFDRINYLRHVSRYVEKTKVLRK